MLRVAAATVVAGALTVLAVDLVEKESSPPRRTTPAPTPATEEPEPQRETQLVRATDPTVYDSQEDLRRCARPRGRLRPASDIETISARVERLRRLDLERRVDTRLVSRAEVGERFVRRYLRRYGAGAAARDSQVLAALRLVPEGTDVRAVTAQLLSGGVAGFYDPRSDRLFSGAASTALTAYEEIVLAHELEHALVDQTLGIPRTESRDPMRSDEMLAHQVLAEGDATLVMSKYAARRLAPADNRAFASRFTQRPVTPSTVPYYVRRTSELTYYEGLLLVCREWMRGGWDGVDRMFRHPPSTTAEVLFPTRSGPEPRSPDRPPSPGRRWKRVPPNAFGAFDLMLLLENADLLSTGETVPGRHVDAVRGWAGGVLRAWLRGDETTVHLGLVDAGVQTANGRRRRLCRVLRGWVESTFPDADAIRRLVPDARVWAVTGELVLLRCSGSSVELVKGPPAAVRRVLGH